MKKILNRIFRIQDGHFISCPFKFPKSVDILPVCQCEDQRYKIALVIGLNMFALEFLGGILTNSLSLLGDSFHLAADSLAIIVALWITKAVKKYKAEEDVLRQIGVIINGSLLLLASAYLLYEAFAKFLDPSGTAGFYMLTIAKIGMFANLLQYHILTSAQNAAPKEDLMRTSIILHIISDSLQSFAIILGGLCILCISDSRIGFLIDPVLSTGISFVMGFASIKLILKAFRGGDEQDHHEHHH